MRKTVLPLVLSFITVLACSPGCKNNEKAKVIVFKPLSEKDFDFAADSSYSVPKGKAWDERKKLHDSCMGSEFPANAMFIRTKDTIRLGTIVNKKTMKIVKGLDIRSIGMEHLQQLLSYVTKPCYDKRPVGTTIDSLLNTKISVTVPGVNKNILTELNNAIRHSVNTQLQTGSWFNAELTDAIGKMLDTTNNADLLEYKRLLLEPDNIILIRSSSVTDITFFINSERPLSAALQALLKQKPAAHIENMNFGAQLFYIDEHSFELSFTGLFQVMGQFMQCSLQ
jgi:hypothetical protein